jgi:hypothetical protein
MATAKQIEAGARAICKARDLSPDTLFQDDADEPQFPEDNHFIDSKGRRCSMFFAWRKYQTAAKVAIEAAEAATDQ